MLLTGNVRELMHSVFVAYALLTSNVLSVRRHTLEILCMYKISGRTRRTTTYASVLYRTRNLCKTYAERVQRTPTYGKKMSHTSAYVGAIRCGVSTPLNTPTSVQLGNYPRSV